MSPPFLLPASRSFQRTSTHTRRIWTQRMLMMIGLLMAISKMRKLMLDQPVIRYKPICTNEEGCERSLTPGGLVKGVKAIAAVLLECHKKQSSLLLQHRLECWFRMRQDEQKTPEAKRDVISSARHFVDGVHAEAHTLALNLPVDHETTFITNDPPARVCNGELDCEYAARYQCNHEHPYEW